MKKLVFDIGTFENIVIIKLIDVPRGTYSAEAEEFDLIDRAKATAYIGTDVLSRNRSMVFDYSYSSDTGDNWKVIIPDSRKAIDIPVKALIFSDAFKAAQFIKCFKSAVQKINSKIAMPISESYAIEWERCE